MKIDGKVVLAIGAHIDDIELGAGASIYQLNQSNTVHYIGLSMPPAVNDSSFLQEFWLSARELGLQPENVLLRNYDPRDLARDRGEILQLFYDIKQKICPDVVFIPNANDIHQSHQVVHQEALRVFKQASILGYELPWNNYQFNADVFIEISQLALEKKQSAMSKFLSQQSRNFFNNGIIEDLAKFRGKLVGKELCECFELIRLVM